MEMAYCRLLLSPLANVSGTPLARVALLQATPKDGTRRRRRGNFAWDAQGPFQRRADRVCNLTAERAATKRAQPTIHGCETGGPALDPAQC